MVCERTPVVEAEEINSDFPNSQENQDMSNTLTTISICKIFRDGGIYMLIRYRGIILTLGIIGGFVWNLLSLLGVIPLEKWRFTFAFVSIAALVNILPGVLHLPDTEVSKNTSQPIEKVHQWMAVTFSFGFAWVVTVIACIVFPL